MVKKAKTAAPAAAHELRPERTECVHCGRLMWADYASRRTLATLQSVLRLRLTVRRCRNQACAAFRKPCRPEAEGRLALPHHEFGLDVIALVGRLRYAGHRCVPEIRDCLSGEVLLARSLLSSRQKDLAALLAQVRDGIGVPVAAVVSDGQHSIRKAVAQALPGVPHQLCHFHYLREAALPVFEADRNAKKELKKRVRKVRPIERAVEDREGPEADAVRGYCSAVRSALTDDGRPPLDAAGLRLHGRLSAISASIGRAGRARKGGCRQSSCA